MIELRWSEASDVGKVRKVNQDVAFVSEALFAVADGMGGHAAGEVAAEVAIATLTESADGSADGLVTAVQLANRAVWDRAKADPTLGGMGTTLCAMAVVPHDGDSPVAPGITDQLLVVTNVGDSRAYRLHDGELDRITEDHSLVEDLVREGRIGPEEARSHPQGNVVTRALGQDRDVEVDCFEIVPYAGDRFLLCSDGLLMEDVSDDDIADVLRRTDAPEDAVAELVRIALDAGGRDNITVVVVDVVDDGGVSEAASAAIADDDEPESTATSDTATIAVSPPSRSEAVEAEPGSKDPRRFTWRAVVFCLAVLLVIGAGVGSVAYFARNTYFVGVDGDEVAIFRGRPGGVLWIQPTLEERTGLDLDDVPESRRSDVEDGKEEPSLEAAEAFVANLIEASEPDQSTDEATTTTTTSAPDPSPTTDTTTSPP